MKCKDCQKYKLAGHGYGLLPKQRCRFHPVKKLPLT
jgi:hypothetical protein